MGMPSLRPAAGWALLALPPGHWAPPAVPSLPASPVTSPNHCLPSGYQPQQPASPPGGWSSTGSGAPPGQSTGADTRRPHSTGTRHSSPERKEPEAAACAGQCWALTWLPAEALPHTLGACHQRCLCAMHQPGTRSTSVAGPGKPKPPQPCICYTARSNRALSQAHRVQPPPPPPCRAQGRAWLCSTGMAPLPEEGLVPESRDPQPVLGPTATAGRKGLPEPATPMLSPRESGPCPRGVHRQERLWLYSPSQRVSSKTLTKRCFINTRKLFPRNTSAPGLRQESRALELSGQSSGGNSPVRKGRHCDFCLGVPRAPHPARHRTDLAIAGRLLTPTHQRTQTCKAVPRCRGDLLLQTRTAGSVRGPRLQCSTETFLLPLVTWGRLHPAATQPAAAVGSLRTTGSAVLRASTWSHWSWWVRSSSGSPIPWRSGRFCRPFWGRSLRRQSCTGLVVSDAALHDGRHQRHVGAHQAVVGMDQLPGTAVQALLLQDRRVSVARGTPGPPRPGGPAPRASPRSR